MRKLVILGRVGRKSLSDGLGLRDHGFERCRGRETADHAVEHARFGARDEIRTVDRQDVHMLRNRDPDVRVPGSRRSVERRHRHANDRPRRAVDRERTREHVGAAAEIVPPESIAHDDDGRAARIAALFERESSSHLERTAEHIEVVAAHNLAVQPPWRRAGRRRDVHRDILIARDLAQCRHVRCEPVDRRDRDRAGPAIIRSEVQRDQFALVDDAGKGTQQQPVRQIEHGSVRADAERKRERRRRRVAAMRDERPRLPDIGDQAADHRQARRLAVHKDSTPFEKQ